MDQGTIQLLFALLRSAISGTKLTEKEKSLFSVEILPELSAVARKHDVINLLAWGLRQNALVAENDADVERDVFKAVYRFEQINFELERLCEALESFEIPFVPLKGSVIRKYYPEPWMRTSCDIDILVHENDVEKAAEMLANNCGYAYECKTSHDVSFYSKSGVHVELHYALVEDGIAKASSNVLKSVWDHVTAIDGYKYRCEMSDKMFYFYHVAHMAKHFENGGCGIRAFIDLWLLDNLDGADKIKRDELLEQGGLLKFAESARRLSRVWFESAEADYLSQQMEAYVLRGGVYGINENRIAVQQHKKGGRIRYALSKIFLSYDEIKFHYPILQKHRWLTPFMEIRRWCKLIFCGHVKRTVWELKYNQSISATENEMTKDFLTRIGLID